jgi:hypothetical protein
MKKKADTRYGSFGLQPCMVEHFLMFFRPGFSTASCQKIRISCDG